MTTTTKAATEINKVVLSEGGYFYNRHDKINGETLQALIELMLQAASQCQALPLQEPTFTGHHQTMGHWCLLVLRQQAPPKRQHHPSFAG
jgi:hypothetical protein